MLGRFCPEDILRYRSIKAISCRNGADVAICETSIPGPLDQVDLD